MSERSLSQVQSKLKVLVCSIVVKRNYHKILESDWLSIALISALIGQFVIEHLVIIGQLDVS